MNRSYMCRMHRSKLPFQFLSMALLTLLLAACNGTGPSSKGNTPVVADSAAVTKPADGMQVIHLKDGGRMEGEQRNGVRVGTWTSYHANGIIRSRRSYVNGVEEGGTEVYHENGMTYYSGQYLHGKEVGIWQFLDPEGTLIRTVEYDSLGNMLEQR